MNKHLTPSFYIIGERKCGSSSLFRYLVDHPRILPGKLKEPNFFIHDEEYLVRHFNQYLENFPTANSNLPTQLTWPELNKQGILYEEKINFNRKSEFSYLTGEASANTYFDVPARIIKRFLPDVKLILLVRNPVDRAFSHYRMFRRFASEGRNIGWELGSFTEEIALEIAKMEHGQWGQFLSPSCYSIKFPEWNRHFGRDQLRVYDLSDFENMHSANQVLQEICQFLDIKPHPIRNYKVYNQAPTEGLSTITRKYLQDFFKPYNQAFFHYLGKSFSWS